MKRRGRPTPTAELVRSVLGEQEGLNLRHGKQLLRVFRAFQSLGPPLTRRAEPVRFVHGVLTLRVFGSTWLTELSFLAPDILRRTNEALGETRVRSIRFEAGPPVMEAEGAPRKLTPTQLDTVEKLGAELTRPEVRAAVMRAAAAHLSRAPGTGRAKLAGGGRLAHHPRWRRGSGGSSGR